MEGARFDSEDAQFNFKSVRLCSKGCSVRRENGIFIAEAAANGCLRQRRGLRRRSWWFEYGGGTQAVLVAILAFLSA